jgi:FeS assembly SUF system protein
MTLFDWMKQNEDDAKEQPPKLSEQEMENVRQDVIQILRLIYDPEIPVNIYDLGLIYALDVDDAGEVWIRMTLTTPACPVAQNFPSQVEQAVNSVTGVKEAHVELVWDPPWSRELMSETALLELGLM